MQAGRSAGMMSVAVPPALSARGSFGSADAVFDGFGPGGGITWRRLQGMLSRAAG
jgi:hypothetical protein